MRMQILYIRQYSGCVQVVRSPTITMIDWGASPQNKVYSLYVRHLFPPVLYLNTPRIRDFSNTYGVQIPFDKDRLQFLFLSRHTNQ